MSNLSEIVDSLESNIHKLLSYQQKLEQEKLHLEEEIGILNADNLRLQDEITAWSEKCDSLKLANSLLGSDQHKRETKLKINALIREIDQCIVQLSQ